MPVLVGALIVLLIIAVVGVFYFAGQTKQAQYQTTNATNVSGGVPVATVTGAVTCPTTLQTTVTPTLQNDLNTTTSEKDNASVYFIPVINGQESQSATIATTTDGTGTVTLNCGTIYDVKILSSATDGANINSFSGDANIVNAKLSGGVLTFTPAGSTAGLLIKANQYGAPQIKAYDQSTRAWIYNLSASTASDYSAGTVFNFTSTTNNATATAVGSGGTYDVEYYIQSQNSGHTTNDLGMYVLIKESTTVWNAPVVKLNGVTLTAITLPNNENRAYSSYQYAYQIDRSTDMVNPNYMKLEVISTAITGVDPTGANSPVVALSPIGSYASVSNSNVLKNGAVDDSTSLNQVHPLITINSYMS